MEANKDTPAGEKNRTGTDCDTNADPGAIGTPTGTIDDVFAAVDVPDRSRDDAHLSVKAYAYDDEPGTVVVGVGNGVSATVVLEVEAARALADAIATAAEEADRDVDG